MQINSFKRARMTIKGVKALNNKRFDLDSSLNEPINMSGNNLNETKQNIKYYITLSNINKKTHVKVRLVLK